MQLSNKTTTTLWICGIIFGASVFVHCMFLIHHRHIVNGVVPSCDAYAGVAHECHGCIFGE